MPHAAPIRVFCLYDESHDSKAGASVRTQLAGLHFGGRIVATFSSEAPGGASRAHYLSREIDKAHVILILFSPALWADPIGYGAIQRALRRQGPDARCVPVLYRYGIFYDKLKDLVWFPRDGQPLVERTDEDTQWAEITRTVKAALELLDPTLDMAPPAQALPDSPSPKDEGAATLQPIEEGASAQPPAAIPTPSRGRMLRLACALGLGLLVTIFLGFSYRSRGPASHSEQGLSPQRICMELLNTELTEAKPRAISCVWGRSTDQGTSGALLDVEVGERSIRLKAGPQLQISLGEMPRPSDVQSLLQFAGVLRRLAEYHHTGQAPESPEPILRPEQPQLSVLDAYVRRLSGLSSNSSAERQWLTSACESCKRQPEGTWWCLLAYYLYVQTCIGSCPESAHYYKALSRSANTFYSFVASAATAHQTCRKGPQGSAELLLHLWEKAQDIDPCLRLTLSEPLGCVLESGNALSLGSLKQLQDIEDIPPSVSGCPSAQIALALAHRAGGRARRGLNREAAQDFAEAYRYAPEPRYRLHQAECLLVTGDNEGVQQLLEPWLDSSSRATDKALGGAGRVRAAYYLWLTAPQRYARFLFHNYAALKSGPGLIDETDKHLQSFACAAQDKRCTVYWLLREQWADDLVKQLGQTLKLKL